MFLYGIDQSTPQDIPLSEYAKFTQKALNILGKYNLSETGSYDTATYNAIVNYQTAKGLTVSGAIDEATWKQLFVDLAAANIDWKTLVTIPITTTAIIPAISIDWKILGIAGVIIVLISMFRKGGE